MIFRSAFVDVRSVSTPAIGRSAAEFQLRVEIGRSRKIWIKIRSLDHFGQLPKLFC